MSKAQEKFYFHSSSPLYTIQLFFSMYTDYRLFITIFILWQQEKRQQRKQVF